MSPADLATAQRAEIHVGLSDKAVTELACRATRSAATIERVQMAKPATNETKDGA